MRKSAGKGFLPRQYRSLHNEGKPAALLSSARSSFLTSCQNQQSMNKHTVARRYLLMFVELLIPLIEPLLGSYPSRSVTSSRQMRKKLPSGDWSVFVVLLTEDSTPRKETYTLNKALAKLLLSIKGYQPRRWAQIWTIIHSHNARPVQLWRSSPGRNSQMWRCALKD